MPDIAAYARWLRLQRSRVQPGLSQRRLAKEAGITGAYISKLEQMDRPEFAGTTLNPHEHVIDSISRVLERYLSRPLVNEAREVIGYPVIANAEQVAVNEERGRRKQAVQEPDADEVLDMVKRLLAMPEHTRHKIWDLVRPNYGAELLQSVA